ncbi:MAG: alginate lyase family protein, partial [bacterium]|nr:alginate lyase family protein [bacterium]
WAMSPVREVTPNADQIDHEMPLTSLKVEELLPLLNLSGVEGIRDAGDRNQVFGALLKHYRKKYPLEDARNTSGNFETADKICRHVIQWGPYEEADYGPVIDWEWDPRGDIEWVAAVFRFYWAAPLAQAFAATGDEKYARTFVDLTTDWMAKHKLETHTKTHGVYKNWNGFVWLDIQTGIRATNICSAFRKLVHAESFTPAFLEQLMTCLYDHQVKTKLIPMGLVHNKAVFEQRGFINIAYAFREFKESREWMELAMERVSESLLAQTTTDGVQREWSYGYHNGVLRDAVEIMERMEAFGIAIPEDYLARVRLMHDYIFWIAAPDLGAPLFGDGSRPNKVTDDRSKWPLYGALMDATKLLGDPKFEARAKLDRAQLPAQKSKAFEEAGLYVMRSDWGPDQIHMALHCSPPAISGHDQPDNNTFELYAHGRWLMPDSGFYTYGHDAEGRAWHRQTRVHQTMTLDGKDVSDDGRHLLWVSEGSGSDVLVVENGAYEHLDHRRSVWFVDRSFFVILDEAIGKAKGQLDLHFQFSPGDVVFDEANSRVYTQYDDANVLVQSADNIPVTLVEEEGWFAWAYGHRTPRKACRFALGDGAPTAFLTVVVPYKGAKVPKAEVALPEDFAVGADRVELSVEVLGREWTVGRDLKTGKGWAK